jgi:ribosomal protein L37AE/L43A
MNSFEESGKRRAPASRDEKAAGNEGATPLPMRRCRECRRAGSARSRGVDLCEECDATIAGEVHERVLTIQETFRKLKEGASVQARVRHWDLILSQAKALLPYEEREILTTCPPPSTLLQDLRVLRDAAVGSGQAGISPGNQEP